MLGSSASIADANIMINTAVAEVLRVFADELEAAEDFEPALQALIRKTIINHKRIIFNGNGYEDAWVEEAKRRGLINARTTPDSVPCLLLEKNVQLFDRHNVFSRTELESRHEIMLESYIKVVNIEALTMVEMVKREILPAVSSYVRELTECAAYKKQLDITADYEIENARTLSLLLNGAWNRVNDLERALSEAQGRNTHEMAFHYRDCVIVVMNVLRSLVDEMETLCDKKHWPYPCYGDLLFSVK